MATIVMALSCGQNKAQKALVLYYSQTGNTRAVAEEISSRLGADIEEIVATEPYDGDFQATIERCLKEREQEVLPVVELVKADLKDYDVIFLGYPVWFGTFAPPVISLLGSIDLAGKKVVPFCTFGSGGLDSSVRDLKEKQPQAEVLEGYGVRAARMEAVPQEIDRFLKEGGYLEGEYEKLEDFSEWRPVTDEESAIFDAAVGGYPMLHAKAVNVQSRPVSGGMEYLFEAENIPSPDSSMQPFDHPIKVYVIAPEGKAPEFTQVLR